MVKELNIYFLTTLVGKLNLISQNKFEFQYCDDWCENPKAFPLSTRLPINKKIYTDEEVRPFFENLLPESDTRQLIARQFHLSKDNIFGILEKIGGDCAGAISLIPKDQLPEQFGDYIAINETELDAIVENLPKHPLLADRNLRLSLAGVQSKLPIYIKDEKFYLTKGFLPSSHILKPPSPHFEHTVINEFFCMKLAQQLGLHVPQVFIKRNNHSLFIIERFDRAKDNDGKLIRIHQEDFCQASGLLSHEKYESEGGPTLEDCFSLIRTYSSQPSIDIISLLKWVVFNYLIGNADAHAKNLSFIINNQGIKLSPFYDILCTHIYPNLNSRYAMKIGRENRPKWIQKRHWERFSESVQIKFSLLSSIMKDMVEKYNTMTQIVASETFPIVDETEKKFISNIITLSKKRIQEISIVLSE